MRGLPARTHNILLPLISRHPPLLDEIAQRFNYIQRCLSCDSEMITFVTGYGITVGYMASPIGSSALFCDSKFDFCTSDISVVSPWSCSCEFFVDQL